MRRMLLGETTLGVGMGMGLGLGVEGAYCHPDMPISPTPSTPMHCVIPGTLGHLSQVQRYLR
jgi:hypothetical protein